MHIRKQRLLTPGPTPLYPPALHAMMGSDIHHRTEEMINQGLVAEVQSLEKYKHLNALRTVGYTEIFNFLDQKISLEEAIGQIKINTRQYAKRQLTWFKKDSAYTWFAPTEIKNIVSYADNQLNNY